MFKWVYWIILVAAGVTLAPLWLPLLLAAWFAHLARPMVDRMERHFRGRRRLAVAIVVFVFFLVLVPLSVAVVQLVAAVSDLVGRVLESPEWQSSLRTLVANNDGSAFPIADIFSPRAIMQLLQQHGGVALGVLRKIFGVTAAAVINIFVFFLASWAFLHDGAKMWAWIVNHSPIEARALDRLRAVFHETGRGLLIGVGLTSLAQAILATVAYAALGVPRAFLLGELTFFAAFIPSFGTALVWLPIAAGLALSGDYVSAGILGVVGVFVVGTIDNILRPVFSRWGQLDLPVFVLILSIFGGFTVFGAWGFVLGPLFVRLAKEVLIMAREKLP